MFEQPRGDAPHGGLRRLVYAAPILIEDVVDASDRGLAGENFSTDVRENVS